MIEYREAGPDDYETVRQFLADNGWEKRVADLERFQKMMMNASRAVVALDGGRVVGFARAITDGASNGYIGTVAVEENRRGQGIGRQMVKRLMGDDPQITWVLRAGHGSDKFGKRWVSDRRKSRWSEPVCNEINHR